MRRQPFKPWTAWIRSCRSRRDAPNATVLSTTATGHSPYMPRSIPPPAACTAKPPLATPAASSSPFSRKFVSLCPPRQQIHIILDNLSAHKTQAVREFLQQHPRVQFHFTPTYSSWLNQVEIWFAKLETSMIPSDSRSLRLLRHCFASSAVKDCCLTYGKVKPFYRKGRKEGPAKVAKKTVTSCIRRLPSLRTRNRILLLSDY